MNYTHDIAPEKLQETFHRMLMTLEYGGSVNMKRLEELELRINQSHDQSTPIINN